MSAIGKGVIIAVLHVVIICSLAGKLIYDRHSRPRVWVQTVGYDPDLPIRGRYVQMRVVVETDIKAPTKKDDAYNWIPVRLQEKHGRLFAEKAEHYSGLTMNWQHIGGGYSPVLTEPVLYFIPDTAKDPTRLSQGERLWVEVTVPKKGPPRPIQLAVSRDGKFTTFNDQ